MKLVLFSTILSATFAKTYFKETFDTDAWKSTWVQSTFKDDYGVLEVTAGKFFADPVTSRGLRTTEDAHFYAISAPFEATFDNSDKDMVVQFSAKFEQGIDCGGGYVKILPPGVDLKKYNADVSYNIMFGPDICGSDKKTHVILHHGDKGHLLEKVITPESDESTHLYTLILKPDNSYKVLIDNVEKQSGTLGEDWSMFPPKEIKDPKASKPADWVDEQFMNDPEDVKPASYDDIPATIVDPSASKPEDWDDDMDGAWEAPVVPNPEFKGEWKAKQIPNPAYKGPWVHPMIANPEYKEDSTAGKYKSGAIAFDLWQVKSGSIFDDIIVTDSISEALEFAKQTFLKKKPLEAASKKDYDVVIQKKAEEEMKKAADDSAKTEMPIDMDAPVGQDSHAGHSHAGHSHAGHSHESHDEL